MKAKTLAALGLAALAAGCADNNTSVEWFAICAPTADCRFADTCEAVYIGTIGFDPANTGGYGLDLFFEVHNQRPNNADPTIGRLNTNDAFITQMTVSYSAPVPVPAQTVTLFGTVPAAGSSIVYVPAVPVGAATALGAVPSGQTVTAHVVASGKYADESTFETASLDIPIYLCSGCTGSVCSDGSAPVGYCPHAGQEPAAPVCATTAP